MKLRWLKSNQHLQPVMRLLKVGDVLDTDDLGISDDTARDWIAAGYAARALKPEPIPEPIEEIPPINNGEADSTGSSKYKRRKKIGG
jgi:hypothetical protein